MPRPDDIFLKTYTFKLRLKEFRHREGSHTLWAMYAIVSTRGRSYKIPTTPTAFVLEATQGKRPKIE